MLFPASILELGAWMNGFILVFIRISAMMASAPFFSANTISIRVRIVMASLITLVLLPVLPPPNDFELMSGAGALAIVQQLAIGLAMGFVLQMVFSALVVAGQVIAMTMGLGFATSFDPQNNVQVTVISQFYVILATLVFLSMDLHLHLISYLGKSFEFLPMTGAPISEDSFMLVVGWAAQMFAGAVSLAMPILAVILLINVGFGVMTRAAPQLNIFAVGFPVTIVVGFVFMMITMPNLLPLLTRLFEQAFENINLLLPG